MRIFRGVERGTCCPGGHGWAPGRWVWEVLTGCRARNRDGLWPKGCREWGGLGHFRSIQRWRYFGIHPRMTYRQFWSAIEKDPRLLANLTLILIDYFFAGEEINGNDLAQALRMRVSCPLLLCSNGEFPPDKLMPFHCRINKDPISWDEIQLTLARRGSP